MQYADFKAVYLEKRLTLEEWKGGKRQSPPALTASEVASTIFKTPSAKVPQKLEQALNTQDLKAITGYIQAAPANIKAAYHLTRNDIKVLDKEYPESSRYSPDKRGLFINLDKDRQAYKGRPAYSYLMHEIGHFIDHKAGGYKSWNSATFGGGKFEKTLRRETENYLKAVRLKLTVDALRQGKKPQVVTDETVYNAVIEELFQLSVTQRADVSDMFHGATLGKVHGGWGHTLDYWAEKDSLPREAFAEMFYATVANADSLAQIKKYFPDSYQIFLEIVEDFVRRSAK